ncbi:ribosome biogenesis GTP-binding protein YihA/YsxC [Paenibacillus taichungensis]|uniref:Probable GTP-binding protein EngB n=2 Tax=Paenibacillus TaxID=44249 RepID=A0ABX9BJQ5_9BACL|nr:MULTISPECIES: ribosome biogenesis GTP-binding protein YihA/YsxC [Paenibacillus]MDR9748995.1 ribosome biogenesis GTP-binding protein YihA/YsxC [Paenibacillus taichungensis]MEC0109373.1 ribosome biogenesis GTP-binding protein YihA/YsxC [Paenibacillus taichungensis]MEC0196416.1 ribosome biogenesis GTP-binding protein YihA/YsxC [Paenibacillus taichungensis]NEU64391.1 YihA family ribosome biogenesis GTP-binding protein [Paenibacillus sp. ALJ109b]NUU53708.1 YihA family ribosome biogenesis GTP-bin
MKVNQSEFIISAVRPEQYPEDGLPEIALAGRSNVGKSSLINRLINRKNLARTSSTPGKTQQLNYYKINQDLYFVDFPGYGYAKVSKEQRFAWGKMMEKYLLGREELKLVMQMVDMRHEPSKDDKMMNEWLRHHGLPLVVVATKMDKIPKTRRAKHIKVIKEALDLRPGDLFVPFSSEEGLGKEELWEIITRFAGIGQETVEEESQAEKNHEDNEING